MRKPSFVNSFKTALLVVPLLASCGSNVNTSPVVVVDPNGLLLPDCQDGQLIGVNADQTLTCVTALSGMLKRPNCPAGTHALTSLKDSVTGQNSLSCIEKGSGANDASTTTRINNASTSITNLQTKVTMITSGGGTRAKYLGPSTNTSNGAVISGTVMGEHAANLVCEASYPGNTGAHLCSPFEIYESILIGDKLTQASVDPGPLMVHMQGWIQLAGATESTTGPNENCGSQTYPTGHKVWKNTIFNFAAPVGGGPKVAKFDTRASCATAYKLACCK